jgi:hypothetical protein
MKKWKEILWAEPLEPPKLTPEKAKRVVVELDLSQLDEEIDVSQIRGVVLEYYNVGEGSEWSESVPYKILKVTKAGGNENET